MKQLQEVLDDCLSRIAAGQSTVEECLALYPGYAHDLRPLLQTAGWLARGHQLQPSDSFRNNSRARVLEFARSRSPRARPWLRPAWRVAVGLAVVVLALLASTTALAQTALPGQPLYFWKRATEEVWRAVSPDPVGADLGLVERRTQELVIAANARQLNESPRGANQQPTDQLIPGGSAEQQEVEAVQGLHLALGRLNADENPGSQQRIENALKQEQKKLSKAGLHDKVLDDTIKKGKSKNKP